MDLKKEILKGHNKVQTNKIVRYVGNDPEKFADLVNVFLAGPYRVTQRAAWPLSYCVENHPEIILPHIKKILDNLKKPEIHDAVKRNTVRLLQFIDIPKRFHGQITELCFHYLTNIKEPVAIRVFAMTVLAHICESHPELKSELRIVIEDNLAYASPAFTSRSRKVLKRLDAK
jgi:hypothetical protein